jgi:hypothetical protein
MYILNGTVLVVSDQPENIPDRNMITSAGIPVENGPIEEAKRIPTDKDLRTISTKEAKRMFGNGAEIIDGVTVRNHHFLHLSISERLLQWFVNDPPQL